MWWGPFCSSVHSAIKHRGPCCQSASNMFQLCLQNLWDPHRFSETLMKFYQKNERKIVFSSLLGRKEKNEPYWNLPSEFWGSWTTMALFPLCVSTSLMVSSSSTGVLTANGRGQQPSQVSHFSHEMHRYTSELETHRPFWWHLTVLCDCKSKHRDSH